MKKIFYILLMLNVFTAYTQCWEKVSSGMYHTLAIKDDGTLWGWGKNNSGQLGTGDSVEVSGMVQIGTDNDWAVVATGYMSSVAIKTDGTLWHWGVDLLVSYSEGSTGAVYNYSPVQIGTAANWANVSCGSAHVLARTTEGILWVWGSNLYAQLGIGTKLPGPPGMHKVGNDIFTFSAAGYYHNMAVKSDGTLWMWGDNQFGQQTQSFPMDVLVPKKLGTDTDWQSASGSLSDTMAIKTNGTLWGWGGNNGGALGDGTTIQRNAPVQVNTETDWQTIATAESRLSMAIKQDGSLWVWGRTHLGENIPPVLSPQSLLPENNFAAIVSSFKSAFVITNEGQMLAWGVNVDGQINDSGQADIYIPVNINCTVAGVNDNTLVQISLYPNPTSSALALSNADDLNIENIIVTDMTGKTVLSQRGNNPEINVEVLPQGIYFLSVWAQEGVQHLKFVKE